MTWREALAEVLVYASAGLAVVAGIVALLLLALWLTTG